MAGTKDQARRPTHDIGADFSNVRPHRGAGAASASAGLGASAYTTGAEASFGGAAAGGRLLPHEATHVVQQGAGIADINAAVGHYAR